MYFENQNYNYIIKYRCKNEKISSISLLSKLQLAYYPTLFCRCLIEGEFSSISYDKISSSPMETTKKLCTLKSEIHHGPNYVIKKGLHLLRILHVPLRI